MSGKRQWAKEDVKGLEEVAKRTKKDYGKVVKDVFEKIDMKQVKFYKKLATLVEVEEIQNLKEIIKNLRLVLDEAEEELKNKLFFFHLEKLRVQLFTLSR